MRLKNLFTFGLLIALTVSGWAIYRATINLSGKCESLGRTLTLAEKRSKLIGHLLDDKYNPWSIVDIFKYTEKNNPSEDSFSISMLNNTNENATDFWIYPDFPAYVKRPDWHYDGYVVWKPVPLWYRLTGYASNLVFFDLRMTGTFKNGRVVTTNYDYRAWINSCGDTVSLPEEYEVG